MAHKFIPDADGEFAKMARVFADNIAAKPGCYSLSAQDAVIISRAVKAFRDALALTLRPDTRTRVRIIDKDRARTQAERIVRQYGTIIRANPDISTADLVSVGVRQRPTRLQRRSCPRSAPYLRFVSADRDVHVLEFRDYFGAPTRAKPRGAARLELFVEFVAPDAAIPTRPGDRPWYLRSFTTNPIRVQFPMPPTPMVLVYWGRWADATGAVGRWSDTVVARLEGSTVVTTPMVGAEMRLAA